MQTPSQRPLWNGFIQSSDRYPERPAVVVEDKIFSYVDLRVAACRIAATIQARREYSPSNLTAVLAYRSPVAFAAVLGSLLAGNGYVPLNRNFPIDRTKAMFQRSGCTSIVVDSSSLHQLPALLAVAKETILVLLPEETDVEVFRQQWPQHIFVGSLDLSPAEHWKQPAVTPDAIAYLLFTSGSTGIPKGVMVAHRNVTWFLDYMVDRYQVSEVDRFSQMFDMTFDLSVFDMFVCWERGACLCCPSQKALINPGKFIQEMKLTIWFSVPSTAIFMKRLGMLKPGRYPSLRFSLFCGEPLPISSTQAWSAAAPNSIVENLYGPTELTIACTLYRWDGEHSLSESESGIVPIGYPYPGMKVLIVDDNLNEVESGAEGELLMAGPQRSLGYWKDSEKTAAAFVTPPGSNEIFYRTGDRVRRPKGKRPLTHLGRTDFQVKILGHRVELGEVEQQVRNATGCDGVVALGWPVNDSGYGGVEVFVEGRTIDQQIIRQKVASKLPEYMVPRKIHFMDQLPRNVNDKFDRKAMIAILERGQ